ncbi:MAG: DEAD/DEAH box helicase family protein [Epsilonproteobacteria bacterium]|nr:DEAD/DEAH box helicase family protein [Campylobacterota bacterium]
MSNLTSENTFETAIVESLVKYGGYSAIQADVYNAEIGFFKEEIIAFLKDSQPKRWEKIAGIHGADVEKRVLARLFKELDLRGSLDVLRNGFTDYGVKFRMAFYQPESGLNPESEILYKMNRLGIARQVYFSRKDKKSIDMVIVLNGLPIVTIELKNHFTGQSTKEAKKQYKETRDPKELLFTFKKRALVHFALDDEAVFMTTRVEGSKTYWLPFNKGDNHGAGNPINPKGYKTSYLWEEILVKDSLLEIVGKFIHLQKEEITVDGRVYTKELMIFPRYHQLDVVRRLSYDAKVQGAGESYLIQHSAGSGKSNSIAWLAYRLSSLHDSDDGRVFDSVIVITDRRVLDKQLQDTIYQFEHKTGVVQKIDKDSTQLADAITNGTNIIITTLQKFPYVLDKVGEIESRNYAVLIDEAHSSQGGDASKRMKEVLGSYDDITDEEEDAEYTTEDFIYDEVEKSAKARGKQSNISFFAFTATPKEKTLAIFGKKDQEGNPVANHLYSMRQAIEEGFILDVLQNYTTYELFVKLTKAIEDDPNLNKKKAAKAIRHFVSFHPHNLAQKSEIIIEHFRQVVASKIGGKAKAMLVTSSRLHAKRYFDAFQSYITVKGYEHEIKVLVAFSGKVMDADDLKYPDGVSEPQLTGYGEKELPEVFKKDEYKILIVADKYQTGFDQPLLHTMYIDKKLSGVKAVQTLSRLNRTAIGKEDTFILDFANDRETILKSFQDYYETTTVDTEPDPNHLYDLKGQLDALQIYWSSEVEAFANIYFNSSYQHNAKMQSQLYALIDPAVDRYKALDDEEKQDEFKKSLRTWTNLYAFVSQIMPFWDEDFEKFYAYAKLLLTKLPKRDLGESLQLDDEIALEYYRLEKIKEGNIELQSGEEGVLQGMSEAGIKRVEEEKEALSEIIKILNEKFGTEFEEADRLFFEQIEQELISDATLKKQAQVNKIDTFKYAFDDMFFDKLFDRMDQNQDIFNKILEDKSFGDLVKKMMLKSVYKSLQS